MECTICLNTMNANDNDSDSINKVLTLKSCNHQFHYGCIHQWLQQNSTCPICRDYVHQILPCQYIKNKWFPSIGAKRGHFKIEDDNIVFFENDLQLTHIPFKKIFRLWLLNHSIVFEVRRQGVKPQTFQYKFKDPNTSLRLFNYLMERFNTIYFNTLRNSD
jgi:hypothetical protein